MESKFIALELAGREAEWLRSLEADIPLWPNPVPSVMLHCDSQSAIHVAKDKAYNGKSRHIRLRHNIVYNLIKFGVILLDYVRSESNITDPLTKALNRKLVSKTAKKMGLSTPM
ncbi:hypothetical protein RND81_06G098800 [Saponaria officinalis]|uniref:Retrovirus-related Pol polyprotein from transposon TNT 1-94 n=1 Tax=Saponaria officinalis TaxID=3572 RepID=A0AAW1K581_SAPOF